ncbi:MAG: HNH endonuclease [Anaerolineae bacterium]|nr:HNH endonuclease [Anaerolineae bacterium]
MTKQISLSRGLVALVDDADFEYLNQWKWHYAAGYASRNSSRIQGRRKPIRMHRVIMQAPDGIEVDHIDTNNKLDNRRQNLRLCTHVENMSNQKRPANNKSGYKGVCWRPDRNKWQCSITSKDQRIHVGYFLTAEEAAHAYDAKARKLFGVFARTNF